MRRVSVLLLIFIVLYMAGCRPPVRSVRPAGTVVQEFHVGHPFSELWDKLLNGVTGMRLPIETVDRDAGIVTTGVVRTTPAEAAKLSYHSATYTYGLLDYCQYRVTIRMQPEGNRTRVRISPYYEGFYIEDGASRPVVLMSNGSLERQIFERLEGPREDVSSTR